MSGHDKDGVNRDQFAKLVANEVDFIVAATPAEIHAAQTLAITGFDSSIVFPGAFNPLHDGHLAMAQLASRRLRRPVWLEISVENVDKPDLNYVDVADRTLQAHQPHGLILTRTPTFERKAKVFAGCVFVVGSDTIARINEPRYYHDDVKRMHQSLQSIAEFGCRFLVFARKPYNKGSKRPNFKLGKPLNPQLKELCEFVSAEEFLMEISSTEIRRRQKENDDSKCGQIESDTDEDRGDL